MGLELACAVKEETETPVVAFQRKWGHDDLKRSLQLGVDILLPANFNPHDLFTELQSLQETGASISRRKILEKAGDDLLQPDPELWNDQNDNWRDRMMSLADQLIRPWAEETSHKASHLESTVIRGSQLEQIPPNIAKAMLEVVEFGRDRLPEIAANYNIPATELSQVIATMESFCRKHGATNKMPLLIDEVLRKNGTNEGAGGPQLSYFNGLQELSSKPLASRVRVRMHSTKRFVSLLGYPIGCPRNSPRMTGSNSR